MSRVTLKDIADACGLSRSAVSLVLQDSPRVSEATKARVRAVMTEMGYVYDRGAAHLRTRRSMTVGLIVTNVRNPYFAELTMAVEQRLQSAGYTVLQGYSFDEPGRQGRLVSAMVEHGADGVIILPAAETSAEALQVLRSPQGTPTVLIARRLKGFDADYTGADNVKAGELLGEHIRGLGARSVIFVGGPAMSIPREDRYRGLARELRRGGITLSPRNQYASPSTAADGERITYELLRDGAQPDIIVAYSDAVATGVLHALRDSGLRAGADIGVAGFDDVADTRYQDPPLTAVATFPGETGTQAARLLLARIDNPGRPCESVIIAPQLNVRESTAGFSLRAPRRLASGADS